MDSLFWRRGPWPGPLIGAGQPSSMPPVPPVASALRPRDASTRQSSSSDQTHGCPIARTVQADPLSAQLRRDQRTASAPRASPRASAALPAAPMAGTVSGLSEQASVSIVAFTTASELSAKVAWKAIWLPPGSRGRAAAV